MTSHAGILFAEAGRLDAASREAEAIPLYREALAAGLAGDERRLALVQLGSSLRVTGDLTESLAALDSAAAEFPGDPDVVAFRALSLVAAGRSAEAVGGLVEAVARATGSGYTDALTRYAGELGATGVGSLTQLVLECADGDALSGFWAAVLDLPPATGRPEWRTLLWPPVGRLACHAVPGYEPPPWPGEHGEQQAHIDLLVDDLDAATERVVGLGAEIRSEVLDADSHPWRIFTDPAGHPFCLVTAPE